MGSQIGVAIAAVADDRRHRILRELDFLKEMFGSDFDPTQYRMLLFGFAMVVIMIWKPRGLDLDARALGASQGAQGDRGEPREGGARMSDAAPLLRVEHLTMRFGGLVAVNDLSFDAPGAATSPR